LLPAARTVFRPAFGMIFDGVVVVVVLAVRRIVRMVAPPLPVIVFIGKPDAVVVARAEPKVCLVFVILVFDIDRFLAVFSVPRAGTCGVQRVKTENSGPAWNQEITACSHDVHLCKNFFLSYRRIFLKQAGPKKYILLV